MFRWIFSQDTEEIAELFVMLIVVFMSDFKNRGTDVLLDEIKNFEHTKEFRGKSQTFTGAEGGCTFYFDGPLREFFFDIIDRRKIRDGSMSLLITGEDGRYYGFRLFCDLLTGLVTVRAEDSTLVSMNGKRATRKARKLCKVFAQRYGSAMSGTIVDWRRVLSGRM
jgi:hypothetical protein